MGKSPVNEFPHTDRSCGAPTRNLTNFDIEHWQGAPVFNGRFRTVCSTTTTTVLSFTSVSSHSHEISTFRLVRPNKEALLRCNIGVKWKMSLRCFSQWLWEEQQLSEGFLLNVTLHLPFSCCHQPTDVWLIWFDWSSVSKQPPSPTLLFLSMLYHKTIFLFSSQSS